MRCYNFQRSWTFVENSSPPPGPTSGIIRSLNSGEGARRYTREFLKTAASSLTGPGAPGILNAQSTGNPVRYGFIGTGTEGCNLLKFLATIPEGRCIATCDIYPPSLRSGDETCPLLLVVVGGESSDEAAVCQYAVADRWTAASVGIAEAAAPKKTIPLSSRNRELSEKAGFGCQGDRLSGPGTGRLGGGGTVREKNPARRSRLEANGCILATAGRPKN